MQGTQNEFIPVLVTYLVSEESNPTLCTTEMLLLKRVLLDSMRPPFPGLSSCSVRPSGCFYSFVFVNTLQIILSPFLFHTLYPPFSETLGFVVLESMASGVPVVGCAAGGIPDLIRDDDTGFLVQTGDIEGYVNCAKKLMDNKFRKQMGVRARKEAQKWGWEAATSVLRNVQYEKALINFHSRAFGGFGRPKTSSVWRLLRMRIARVLGRLRIPGFRRNGDVASPI